MSQNWNGHWVEENFKPSRLGNWEVPNWHPEFPVRHCRTTTFQCDNKGHLLAHIKKPNRLREYFKTTWELPKKIDRRLAEELSAPPKYKKLDWEAHKTYHRATCGDSSKEELKSEKILSDRPLVPKPKAKPKSKLHLKSKASVSNLKSDKTDLKSELKYLEPEVLDSKSKSECSQEEGKINKVACLFHQTCKI